MANDVIGVGVGVGTDVISLEVKHLFEFVVLDEKQESPMEEEGETKFCIMCRTRTKFCS